jgi:hypothetical protein
VVFIRGAVGGQARHPAYDQGMRDRRCPKCDEPCGAANVDEAHLDAGKGIHHKGLMFSCVFCGHVLGFQLHPDEIAQRVADEVMKRLNARG